MFEDEGVEDVFGGFLLIAAQLIHGLELEFELFVGPSLVGIEHQGVGGDAEGFGELAEPLEGGLGAAGLVAADLDRRALVTWLERHLCLR